MHEVIDKIFWWTGCIIALCSLTVVTLVTVTWLIERLLRQFRIHSWLIRFIFNYEKFKKYWDHRESERPQAKASSLTADGLELDKDAFKFG